MKAALTCVTSLPQAGRTGSLDVSQHRRGALALLRGRRRQRTAQEARLRLAHHWQVSVQQGIVVVCRKVGGCPAQHSQLRARQGGEERWRRPSTAVPAELGGAGGMAGSLHAACAYVEAGGRGRRLVGWAGGGVGLAAVGYTPLAALEQLSNVARHGNMVARYRGSDATASDTAKTSPLLVLLRRSPPTNTHVRLLCSVACLTAPVRAV